MSEPRSRRSLNHYFPAGPAQKLAPGKRRLDALLRRLGPTWRASPARRVAQVLALAVFLQLFFVAAWPYATTFSSQLLSNRAWAPSELFLWLDPLVGLSTAIAARSWNVGLWGALAVLLLCVAIPRGFCGYLCPLGTLIDAFDWLIGKRVSRLRVKGAGRWRHLRYYLLAAVLAGSACGVLLSGYVAAIPVVTRGLLFTAGRLQLGLMKNWGQVAPATGALAVSVALFGLVFLLSLLGPRFWCRYVCPSGALLSLFSLARLAERKVEASCTRCGRCASVCPFDAVGEEFATRPLECAFCQTCGGACPAHAIRFAARGRSDGSKPAGEPPAVTLPLSRRALLGSVASGAAAAAGIGPGFASVAKPKKLLRPPGSAAEARFLDLCIRCGECFKVCPGPVLHPAGLEGGWDALWTPVVVPSHAGCHQECNFCTQVCPTHAIRPLPLERKRSTHIGLAVIDAKVCLPHRGERDCKLCFDECEAAGYHAIQMREIQLAVGNVPEGAFSDSQIEEMGRISAPFVDAQACVGCGLCEYRCHGALVRQQNLIPRNAVVVVPENEDRW